MNLISGALKKIFGFIIFLSFINNTQSLYEVKHKEAIYCYTPKVVQQSELLGGKNSCCYHALKNGFLLANYFNKKVENRGFEDLKSLSDEDIVIKYFGSDCAVWKAAIKKDRLLLLIYLKLLSIFRKFVPDYTPFEEDKKNRLNEICFNLSQMATQIDLNDRNIKLCYIPDDIIQEQLKELGPEFSKYKDDNTCAFFINENDNNLNNSKLISENLAYSDIVKFYTKKFSASYETDLNFVQIDEALSERELQNLIDLEKARENSLLDNKELEILYHTYFTDDNYIIDFSSENFDKISHMLKNLDSSINVLCFLNIQCHTVVLFINKISGKKADYILADSDSFNSNNNIYISEFISNLEGNEVTIISLDNLLEEIANIEKYIFYLKSLVIDEEKISDSIEKIIKIYNEINLLKEEFNKKTITFREFGQALSFKFLRLKCTINLLAKKNRFLLTLSYKYEEAVLNRDINNLEDSLVNSEKNYLYIIKNIGNFLLSKETLEKCIEDFSVFDLEADVKNKIDKVLLELIKKNRLTESLDTNPRKIINELNRAWIYKKINTQKNLQALKNKLKRFKEKVKQINSH